MTDVLTHYGITGQKWGVRRYQNEDGTLTDAGKKRYLTGEKLKSTVTKALNIKKHSTGWQQIEPNSSGGGSSSLEKKLAVEHVTTNSRLTDENIDHKLIKALGGGSDIGNALAKAKKNVQIVLRTVGETMFKAAMKTKETIEKGKKNVKNILNKIGNELTKALNIKHKTSWTTVSSQSGYIARTAEGSVGKANIARTAEGSTVKKKK